MVLNVIYVLPPDAAVSICVIPDNADNGFGRFRQIRALLVNCMEFTAGMSGKRIIGIMEYHIWI